MTSLTHGASRGAAWHGVAQLCLTASGYIVAVVLARSMGPIDFGTYGVIYSLLMALELTVNLGIPGAIARLIAERESDEQGLGGTAVTLVALCSATAFTVLWPAAPLLASALNVTDGAVLLRVAIIDIPFFGAYHVTAHVLNGRRDFITQSVATIFYSITKVIGMVVLGYLGISIAGALVVNIAASVVGLIIVARVVGRGIFVPTLACAAPILRLAGPVALIGLGTQFLLYVDLWSIGAFAVGEPVDKGFYVAAKNLARIPNLLSFVMMAVLVPSIGRARATGDVETVARLIKGTTRFLAVTLLPGCALMAIEARPLMELMFSAAYTPGAPYLTLLVLANGLFHTLMTTAIAILLATKRQRLGAVLAVSALVPSLAFSALLVPKFGAIGAAYSTVLASALTAIAAGYAVRQEAGALFDRLVLIKALLVTIVVGAVGLALPTRGLLLVLEMAALMLAALGLSVALRIVTRADLAPFQGGSAS